MRHFFGAGKSKFCSKMTFLFYPSHRKLLMVQSCKIDFLASICSAIASKLQMLPKTRKTWKNWKNKIWCSFHLVQKTVERTCGSYDEKKIGVVRNVVLGGRTHPSYHYQIHMQNRPSKWSSLRVQSGCVNALASIANIEPMTASWSLSVVRNLVRFYDRAVIAQKIICHGAA